MAIDGGSLLNVASKSDFLLSLKLLRYEVNLMSGQAQIALKELNEIRSRLLALLKDEKDVQQDQGAFFGLSHLEGEDRAALLTRFHYWYWLTECHLINFNIRSRNWKNALQLSRKMSCDLDDISAGTNLFGSPSSVSDEDKLDIIAAKIVVLCRTARLLLQVSSFSLLMPIF